MHRRGVGIGLVAVIMANGCYALDWSYVDAPGKSWRSMTLVGAPSARARHVAVFDDMHGAMIVWGGATKGGFSGSGGIYHPASASEGDRWSTMSAVGSPDPRADATAIWDATHAWMIVWGGVNDAGERLNTGGVYSTSTDIWKPITTDGAPFPRSGHTAVWTGTEMIVCGGYDGITVFQDCSSYDPVQDAWTANFVLTLTAREAHTAVWAGSSIWIWGGLDPTMGMPLGSGASWDFISENPLPSLEAPSVRSGHTAVWTGITMWIWGGKGVNESYPEQGAGYRTGTWHPMKDGELPGGRDGHSAVWIDKTGDVIVWGGADQSGSLSSGARFHEETHTWSAIGTGPSARHHHTAVVTGDGHMIVWGGEGNSGFTNSGAVFDPTVP